MKNKFAVAVAVAALYGTALYVAPASAQKFRAGVEAPLVVEAVRAPGPIAAVPAASFAPNAMIQPSAALAPAATAPEAAAASAIQPETAIVPAQDFAAVGGGAILAADAAAVGASAAHLSGDAAEQAAAAAKDGASMDGAVISRGEVATARSAMATLKSKVTLNAADFKGKPLFAMLIAPDGLKAALDAAETAGFTVADWDTVQMKITAFDPTDPKKIDSLFKSPDGFKNLVDALAGQNATPRTMAGIIASKLKDQGSLSKPDEVGLAGAIISPLLSLASGSGVEFKIDENNTTFHFGYKSGADLANDPKSGRSFSLTAGRTALDPSDNYFLKELGEYFASEDPQKFFEAILPALTQSDFSGWKSLAPKGQTLASDFIAIYLAEADRNDMTDFKTHPWQKDLAAVTFLSSYAVKAGKVWKDGKPADGLPSFWFGIGKAGSGIGESRMPRKEFTRAITSAERTLHPDVVSAVEKLIGTSDDAIQGFTDYINDPSKQAEVEENADALNAAMAAFLSQIHADADAITKALSAPVARASVPVSGAMSLVAQPWQSAAAPDPALVRAAVNYQKNDELESDTETTGPLAAYMADGNALLGRAHADFTAWNDAPGAMAPDVWKVHLRDAQKTLAYYMFQTIPGVGVNFAFYTLDGRVLASGSQPENGENTFGRYLDTSKAPLFGKPSPSDPKGNALPLSPEQIAALTSSIQKGVSDDSGWNDLDLAYAAPADAGVLKGDALALFNRWMSNPVSRLPPPAGDPADMNKPAVFRTTLHVGGVATPMIYMVQSKVTTRFAPDWRNFAFFTTAGQLIVDGSYNRGLKWGRLVDPTTAPSKP